MMYISLFVTPGFDSTQFIPESRHGAVWPWLTVLLSTTIVFGYALIAFNWFYQAKLRKHAEARTAQIRLRNILIICAACGVAFFAIDIPWFIWRFYDGILLVLGVYTWTSIFRMRSLSLVDERMAELDELERSTAKYREIAQLLPHMVWTADAEGRVDFSNERWREYAGDNRTWLEAVHPEEREKAMARWRTATAARLPISLELRLGSNDGGYRTFLVKANTISSGTAVKWLGACADIEDQRQLATQREAQVKQKSFWLNALSHDLRAPLHNITLNAHLLKISAKDPSDVDSVEMIIENAAAAGDLVSKLLDFAKVGAQDTNVMEQIAIAPMLQNIVRRFQKIVDQKGLYLRLVADEGVAVLSDRHKLERIIANLLDNGIKYTERGGVMLSLVPPDDKAPADDDRIIIRVTDTGIGVSETNVPHLFEEFYQVDNYERDRQKGFGMGLAICKDLARHIGGDIRLAHTGGDGSIFDVIVHGAVRRAAAVSVGGGGAGGGEGIGPDSGGRSLGPAGDHAVAAEPRICSL